LTFCNADICYPCCLNKLLNKFHSLKKKSSRKI
jgi:hypothetical protein